jgi:aspartate racemase
MMAQAEQQPLLGILGGMGPLATVDFLGKLTRSLPAKCDQDHLPWITLSQPGIPDRSRAIQNGDDGPGAYLIKGVAWLAAQGVQFVVIPCNTSHFWYDRMQAASSVPIIHIADAAVTALEASTARQAGQVAILATRGTVNAGIYSTRLKAAGYQLAEMGEPEQLAVDGIIAAVKGGEVGKARQEMAVLEAVLYQRGVKTIILGCTELPIAHERREKQEGLQAVDTSLALAKAALSKLGYLSAVTPGAKAAG